MLKVLHIVVEKSKPLLKKLFWKNCLEKSGFQKKSRKWPLLQSKEMDVNVTIFVGSIDIFVEMLGKIEEFIDKECIIGFCSIERSGTLCWLHMQMVYWILEETTHFQPLKKLGTFARCVCQGKYS